MKNENTKSILALAISSILLTACGGGGSSSNDNTSPTVDTPETPVVEEPETPVIEEPETPVVVIPPVVSPACSHTDTSDGTVVSTLDELITLIPTLQNNNLDDIVYLNAGTYNVTSPIIYDAKGATEKISFIGCGADEVIFDGGNLSRVWEFRKDGDVDWLVPDQVLHIPSESNPTLVMKGLSVINGNCTHSCTNKYGGAGAGAHIQRYTTHLEDVIFAGNKDTYGGAAIQGVGHLTTVNTIFDNNTSSVKKGSAIDGCGGISTTSTVFTNNSDYPVYRGICLLGDYSTPEYAFNFTDSEFTNNEGAIYAVTNAGEPNQVNIIRSTFTNNDIDGPWGAVSLKIGDVNVTDSTFEGNDIIAAWNNNTCENNDYSPCAGGGALNIDTFMPGLGTLTVNGSTFKDNSAPNFGGAISMSASWDCTSEKIRSYLGYCDPSQAPSTIETSMYINGSTFDGNSAHHGAAISLGKINLLGDVHQKGSMILTDVTVINNVSTMVIPNGVTPVENAGQTQTLIAGGDITLDNVTLENNTATQEVHAKGNLINL